MPLFLQILDGQEARNAEPILATRDKEIIALVAKALGDKLGVDLLRGQTSTTFTQQRDLQTKEKQ